MSIKVSPFFRKTFQKAMASETTTTMETEQTTMETEHTKEISKVVYFKLRLPASADNKKTFPD